MYNSYIVNLLKQSLNKSAGQYVFYVNILFYFLLWFFNPSNKLVAAFCVGLLFIYHYRLKDIRVSLLLAYLTSFIIFTGKSYTIQLVPPGIFPLDLYPRGYTILLTISPRHILAFFMGCLLLRDIVYTRFRTIKIRTLDILLVLYYFWLILSDFIASKNPEVSLSFSILMLENVIVYFYIRSYALRIYAVLPTIIWLFASIVLFEAVISFQQFINASPVYKTLETQGEIEYFGNAVDELQFRFRPLGTFHHANELGLALSFFLSLIFALLLRHQNIYLFLIYTFGAIALAMTLSRSAWLGYGTGILATLFIIEKFKKLSIPKRLRTYIAYLSILSAVLIVFFIFPRIDRSIYSFGAGEGGGYLRTLQTQDTLSLIAKNSIFGVGTNMSVQETRALNPRGIFSSVPLSIHNWYLLTVAEHGIPSVVIFIFFVLLSVKQLTSIVRKSHASYNALYAPVGFIAGILSLLIIGFFQPFIGESFIVLAISTMSKRWNTV